MDFEDFIKDFDLADNAKINAKQRYIRKINGKLNIENGDVQFVFTNKALTTKENNTSIFFSDEEYIFTYLKCNEDKTKNYLLICGIDTDTGDMVQVVLSDFSKPKHQS